MKHLIATVLLAVLVSLSIVSAIGPHKAAYVGGTLMPPNRSHDPIEGSLDTSAERQLVFTAEEQRPKGLRLEITYHSVLDVKYGQETGRRVVATMGSTVLLGPIGLLPMSSKQRRHYLTVGYTDEHGTKQVAVFELGKDTVRPTLAVIESRSGKPIDYQDDDSRRLSR